MNLAKTSFALAAISTVVALVWAVVFSVSPIRREATGVTLGCLLATIVAAHVARKRIGRASGSQYAIAAMITGYVLLLLTLLWGFLMVSGTNHLCGSFCW
jgi:hypothetical protein